MAALALALGLADVVSAGSNYSIGALFVDEGFGSLDGDSLDTVIDVLRSLQDGGRMVGVISHVQELKDALPERHHDRLDHAGVGGDDPLPRPVTRLVRGLGRDSSRGSRWGSSPAPVE